MSKHSHAVVSVCFWSGMALLGILVLWVLGETLERTLTQAFQQVSQPFSAAFSGR